MRRSASHGRLVLLAVVLIPALVACGSETVAAPVEGARVFAVTEADGQLLPAHQPCPPPVEGMITGARFVTGELVLYPERTFTWRFTLEQYASSEEVEEAWVAPVTVRGTYAVRGDSLDLVVGGEVVRRGLLAGGTAELMEALPCHFPVEGHVPHEARLRLVERPGG